METTKKKQRQKTVFSSHQEVAHVWASQARNFGRANNIYFDGQVIYSYGSHFPVAKIYPNHNICLITEQKFSISTEKHKGIIQSAIPGNYTRIYCFDPEPTYHWRNLEYYKGHINYNYGRWEKAREKSFWYYREQQHLLINLERYCNFFGIDKPGGEYENYIIDHEEAAGKDNYYKEKREERKRKEEERINRIYESAKPQIKAIEEAWKNNQTNETYLCIGKQTFHFTETLLRVNGNEVQTSRGARVPYNEAKRLFNLYWNHANIEDAKVGHFTVNQETNGGLVIGCHIISRSEIIRFADSQNWI